MEERIIQIMELKGFTSSGFAEEIGIQRAAMSHITSGRNKASLDVCKKVLERFSDIDPDWLLFGNGNRMRENKPAGQPQKQLDLFSAASYIQPEKKNLPEYGKEIRDKTPQNPPKKTENEIVIVTEKAIKKVTKIMIFYSDDTHAFFIPEK